MAASTVAVKFTGAVADLKRSIDEVDEELGGLGSRIKSKIVPGLAVVGAAAGTALVTGMQEKMERDNALGRIQGSLGLDAAGAERLGKAAGSVYGDGFGSGFAEVADAVGTVMAEIGEDLPTGELEDLTRKALDFSTIFETDVGEAVGTVGFLLRNDLVNDATEAFDVLTAGLQATPQALRDEVFPTFAEYSQNFRDLGLDAEAAFGLILETGLNTSVGIDKVGDSIKEFLDRATDGSESTVNTFEVLGLAADETADKLLAGGEQAKEAMQTTVAALLEVEDPAARAQLAVTLFGEPIKDLTVSQIPEFLRALQGTTDALGDVEGASARAAEGLEGDARRYARAMRSLEEVQQDFVTRFVDGTEKIVAGLLFMKSQAEDVGGFVVDVLGDIAGAADDLAFIGGGALTVFAESFGNPIGAAQSLIGKLGEALGIIEVMPRAMTNTEAAIVASVGRIQGQVGRVAAEIADLNRRANARDSTRSQRPPPR